MSHITAKQQRSTLYTRSSAWEWCQPRLHKDSIAAIVEKIWNTERGECYSLTKDAMRECSDYSPLRTTTRNEAYWKVSSMICELNAELECWAHSSKSRLIISLDTTWVHIIIIVGEDPHHTIWQQLDRSLTHQSYENDTYTAH